MPVHPIPLHYIYNAQTCCEQRDAAVTHFKVKVYHFFPISMVSCPKERYCNDVAEGELEQITILIPACAQEKNASVLAPLVILSCNFEVQVKEDINFVYV